MDGNPGREIAGYRIESEIGRGGMGIVYLATQTFPERRVALKLLSPDLASDPAFRERFVRESNAAASIEHPNIVPVYGAGEADGQLYLAMRYVQGTDLHSLLVREGRLSIERAAGICGQVAEALEAAHERGLVHRDVKPANILLDAADRAYLSDFGLIRRNRIETDLTETGRFLGTINYVAPEQIRGEQLDGRADIYSLGCVLYECLAGAPPFARDSEVSTIYAHLQDPPPLPSAVRDDVPEELDAVAVKAMATRPDDRFATAGEMAQALRAGGGPPGTGPRRRRAGLAIAGAAAVVIALVIGVLALGGDGSGGSQTPPSSSPTGTPIPLNSLIQIDPETGEVLGIVEGMQSSSTDLYTAQVEVGEGGVWELANGRVAHVNPDDGELVTTIPLSPTAFYTAKGIAVGGRTVWVGAHPGLVPIDPATDQALQPVALGRALRFGSGYAWSVAFGASNVWSLADDGELIRVDPATFRRTGSVQVGATGTGIAADSEGVWVIDKLSGTLTRVDPRTLELDEPIEIAGELDAVAVGADGVWVLDSSAGVVVRVDPNTGTVGSPIRVGADPTDIAVGLGAVWVTNQGDDTISRIDRVTKIATPIPVGAPVTSIAVDEATGTLWVSVQPPLVTP